ncbi:lamin tail domain-containing protein [Haloarcula amylovorans]|uniref:lamin tail domain-containing protein n=1 Tax=Haloarcula amylovorans TaxID=2562280 RepID=UPI001430EDD4|nr:lamin tail domain-containing protein [Halomicroarcula amylolytica]
MSGIAAFVYLIALMGLVGAGVPADTASEPTAAPSTENETTPHETPSQTPIVTPAPTETSEPTDQSNQQSGTSQTATPVATQTATSTLTLTATASPTPNPVETQAQATPTPRPATPTPQPTTTATPDHRTGTITAITDGDTVDIRFADGSTDTLRLLGVDTPETYGDVNPDEFEGVPDTEAGRNCLETRAKDATEFTRSRLLGEEVTLSFDDNEGRRGSYDRLLVYVSVDGEPFNIQLVEQGYARVYDSQFERRSSFYDAEAAAQDAGIGVWDCRNVRTPTPTPESAPPNSGGTLEVASIHADAPGNDHENLNEEYITFDNTGSQAVDISGYVISDTADHEYTVPEGTTVGAGEQITLYTGSGANSADSLYWRSESAVWNNGGDTIIVEETSGEVVIERTYE